MPEKMQIPLHFADCPAAIVFSGRTAVPAERYRIPVPLRHPVLEEFVQMSHATENGTLMAAMNAKN